MFPAKGPCGKEGISEVYVGGSLFSIICRTSTFEAQSKWSNEKLQPKENVSRSVACFIRTPSSLIAYSGRSVLEKEREKNESYQLFARWNSVNVILT